MKSEIPPSSMSLLVRWALFTALLAGVSPRAGAVILLETGDAQVNASTPGDNSGWQYEGHFHAFLGVPIAPLYFITATHVGGTVGTPLILHGDSYTTVAEHKHPTADLTIWEVDSAKPFATFAPLYTGSGEKLATATLIGRGTQRGATLDVSGQPRGWYWGAGDGVKRWGRNVVTDFITSGSMGDFLYCDFDNPGIAHECHLSVGDSGGGLFLLDGGLWKLAGINYAVDAVRFTAGGSNVVAAIYDAKDLFYEATAGNWVQIVTPTPTSFYCTRLSSKMEWINLTAPGSGSLASESFNAWKQWYFTPAQRADGLVSGPLADFDKDGISTLLEFALNLDPAFNEQVTMTAGTGLRGLPLVKIESNHVTIEFVRRTVGGGGGVTCQAEFSDDNNSWHIVGTEVVTPINSRWERVKVTDSALVSAKVKRFARIRVVL